MIVITLSKVPASLRGDLTKWCQEIQTGVYVGNFSARIRDKLWDRIMKNIGSGEATLVYNTNNELGYTFKTTRPDKKVIYLDGLPFMKQLSENPLPKHGFSKAAHLHRARQVRKWRSMPAHNHNNLKMLEKIVVLDIETTGLDVSKDNIISVSAIKKSKNQEETFFDRYVKIEQAIPDDIVKMTGLTNEFIDKNGESLNEVLTDLKDFIGQRVIVGYNIFFDLKFLLNGYGHLNKSGLANRVIDLVPIVKKDQKFLDNYRLTTVLKEYGIENSQPHNSLSDARATMALTIKLFENDRLKI